MYILDILIVHIGITIIGNYGTVFFGQFEGCCGKNM